MAVDDVSVAYTVAGGTAPTAPTITSITPGDGSLSVDFTAPSSDGGATISNYQYSTDNGATFTAFSPARTTSPLSITGLVNGTAYSVQIKAVNSVGAGAASASVNGTPVASALPPILTATNFAGTVGVAFSNAIPATGSPTNFTLVSGTLPGGLAFNSNNGTITGTPTNAVTNSITVTADNITGTSSNATIGFEIGKGTQTITFAALPAKVVGDAPFTLSATANSGLAVSYASSSTNVATVSGNTVTVVGSGTTTITASQVGDDNWNAATDATQTLTVYPSGVAYWNFNTDTATVTPSGWTVGAVSQGNNNGTTALLAASSVSSGYQNSYGISASGSTNANAAARTGAISTGASGSAYFEFSITAPAGNTNLALTNISFGSRSTGTGPAAYSLRSSIDNYSANLAGGSLTTTSSWSLVSNSLSVLMTNGTNVTFRIYGHNGTGSATAGTANWRIDDLTLGVGELALTSPSLNLIPSSLSGLSTFNGTPSTGSSYTINGSNLTNDVAVTTSGTDLQISADNTTFTNQLTIVPSGRSLTNTTLYVRISAAAAQGALSGAFVRHVSTGRTNDLAVSGNVYDAARGASSNSLVAWDASGQNSFGVSPWSPTVVASNLTVSSGLSRASGVATSGSFTARGWGGMGWSQADAATAVSSNQFVSFTIAATSGYKLSLSGISKLDYRRPASGPIGGTLQVQIGSGTFNDVASLNYSNTATSGDRISGIDLSTNVTLQNIPANTLVTFRIVNFGGTNTGTGTWYIYDKDSNPNVDFEVTGSVEVQTAVAPTITSTNAFSGTVGVAFSNNITASGDTPIVFSGANLPGGLLVASGGAITGTPEAAGTFNATLTATNSTGTNNQAATFTIAKGTATLALTNLSQVYNGTARLVTVTTVPAGLSNSVTYNGSSNAPTNAGSYTVVASVTDSNYTGSTTNTLVISPATATLALTNLSQVYSGIARFVTVTTDPTGLSNSVTYNGSSNAPTNAGSYTVVASVTEANYVGSTTNTLEITKATPAVATNPLATAVTAGQALSNSVISGGTVNPAGGSWAWNTPTTPVTVGTNSYAAVYTPASADQANWNNLTNNLTVVGTQAGESIGDFLPPGTPTNAETVGKWLIGGATNFTNASERPVLVTTNSTNLVLSAIVRTNDPKGQVVGMWVTNLANLPGTNVVTGTRSANQTGFDTNKFERRDFTVERTNGTNRLFLRLRAILQP